MHERRGRDLFAVVCSPPLHAAAGRLCIASRSPPPLPKFQYFQTTPVPLLSGLPSLLFKFILFLVHLNLYGFPVAWILQSKGPSFVVGFDWNRNILQVVAPFHTFVGVRLERIYFVLRELVCF